MSTLAYIRVSTLGQADSGLGMEAQRVAIRAAFNEPAEWFTDEGISGAKANRPGLLAALKALKRGDVLAVAKRDRLGRDVMLCAWCDLEAKKRGAEIRTADGNGNGDDPTAQLLRTIVDAFSQFEKDVIGMRTAAALAAKRARSEKCGGAQPPYGFRIGGYRTETRRGVEVALPLLEEVPEEQAIIRQAREMHKGGMSLRAIALVTGLGHPEKVRRAIGREG